MKNKRLRAHKALVVVAGIAATGLLYAANGAGTEAPKARTAPTAAAQKDVPYIGAEKCKTCHDSDETGNQYHAWKNGPHAKAWEALASDEAKEIAGKMGIADPQKADQCIKCHMTGFGVEEKLLKKGFEKTAGVQCESCHGPGEAHMKARLKATMKGDKTADLSPDEIVTVPPQDTCLQCHNDESPTFEPFCYYHRKATIAHLNPERDHSDYMVCGCPDPCPCVNGCEGHDCPVPKSERKGDGPHKEKEKD